MGGRVKGKKSLVTPSLAKFIKNMGEGLAKDASLVDKCRVADRWLKLEQLRIMASRGQDDEGAFFRSQPVEDEPEAETDDEGGEDGSERDSAV